MNTDFVVYTDGGCRGNPGIGAWGFYLFKDGTEITHMSGFKEFTTNNEMELMAIFHALVEVSKHSEIKSVEIRSDSTYCINTLTDWGRNWIKAGSINVRPNGELVKGLIQSIDELGKSVQITFTKVKGHSGEIGNDMVDQLVNITMDKGTGELVQTKSTEPEVRKSLGQVVDYAFESDQVKLIISQGGVEGDLFIPIKVLIDIFRELQK